MRTVRKVARARNRPRRGLAWLIVLALILLLLVATRASAAPVDDEDGDERVADVLEELVREADGAGELAPEDVALLDELAEDLDDDDDAARLAHHTLDGAAVVRDADERYRKRSRWGRLDLAFAWRRHITQDKTSDAVWLVATWSR